MIRLLLTILLCCAGSALAADLHEQVRVFALREAAAAAGGAQSRIEVSVGAIDARAARAPCTRSEAFLPPGARLWGRGYVGVRCAAGADWSIVVPVSVRIYGPALVAARPLAAGAAVQAEDVKTAEVEFTREPGGVVTQPQQLAGRVLARPVGTGQPIALAALRAPQVVGQGEPVRVVGRGAGFAVGADGVALASAVDGASVRVRTESGRIVTGTARAGRIVEVAF
jgi:flagella basal body P-ring formation protein FlgA